MKKPCLIFLALSLVASIFCLGCDDTYLGSEDTNIEREDTDLNSDPDFEFLKGTWIDKGSLSMRFIDFYSEKEARIGIYGKNFKKFEPFNYRIINSNQIAVSWIDDKQPNVTFHDLIKIGNDTIEISDLTDLPENPNKIYLRREILTGKNNDTIVIGHKQEYFDFENDLRLRIDPILNDSRCPTGVECIWRGNAEVRIELIIQGAFWHYFILNTNCAYRTDTVIDNIRYILVALEPYPVINQPIDFRDYVAKILIEKQ